MTEQNRIEKFKNMITVNIDFLTELIDTGFFTAPASTKYHGAYRGGLFDHSYAMAEELQLLTVNNNLTWQKERSPHVVGLFHDICKTQQYLEVDTGYVYNPDQLLPGHGDKSIILLQQWMSLTEEEMLCIRWHMGAFDDKDNWKYYSKSVAKYPNVLWTHQADMIASQVKGV